MKTSESIKALAVAFADAQAQLKVAKRDKENPFYKSHYADLSAVWEACRESLKDNGFGIAQPTVYHDGHMFIETVLLHSSGEWISGEYLVTTEKPGPQAVGAAVSYARRYALAAMVGVTTEDDDAESATDHSPEKTVTREPASTPSRVAMPSGDMELVELIPSRVSIVPGKGKGAGKMFSEIFGPDGTKYGGDEMQGQMAESAKATGRKLSVVFKRNGNYNNITRGGVKFSDTIPPKQDDEIPF